MAIKDLVDLIIGGAIVPLILAVLIFLAIKLYKWIIAKDKDQNRIEQEFFAAQKQALEKQQEFFLEKQFN